MVTTMLIIGFVTLLSAVGAAIVAPPPRRRIPAVLPVLGAFSAPVLFATILSLADAGHEALGFIAICVMAGVVGTLLWCLRSVGGSGDDGSGGGGGGSKLPIVPESGPRGGGVLWDWDRFEADFAAYVAAQGDRDRELVLA